MTERVDIVVIGAGMVGAAVACLLAEHGDEITLTIVDAREPPGFEPEGDYRPRVSAISRASSRILEAAGAWKDIRRLRASPYRKMCVWDGSHPIDAPGTIRFEAADVGESELGHIVENDLIQHVLLRRLRSHAGASLVFPARPTRIATSGRHATVELDDGTYLRAALVIGADGAGSPTREMAGIGVRTRAYDQTALVCHVNTQKPHGQTAWQRFLPTGPVALLPLSDDRCSVVWSTAADRALALANMATEDFLDELGEATDHVLGKITDAGPRFTFPLQMQMAESYIGGRVALAGDAAHTVHPLAGQGVNLGLLDAGTLAQVVLDAMEAGRDPGERNVLRKYERWRKGENLAAAHGIDAIGRVFRQTGPVVGALRRTGVALLNVTPQLKNEIVRRAMGISGDLPRFARPPEAWRKRA